MQIQNQNGSIWNQVVWRDYLSAQLLSDGHLKTIVANSCLLLLSLFDQ